MHNLHIRPAKHTDLPALEWDGEYTHFRRLYIDVYRLVEKGEALIWVAELPQVGIVGQVFVSLKSARSELSDGKMRAYVYAFRVKPTYRGQGIGSQMMEMLEADLRRRGFGRVTLNVAQENPAARRLYERLGYHITGNDPGRWSYIDDKGRKQDVIEPAWRMEKALRGEIVR
jgi:ribosomal protein S18 acetylase RimI-like enzyme